MMARGLNMMELSVYSGCSMPTISKIDKMDAKSLGGTTLRSILKLSLYLDVAPSDIIPFLGVRPSKTRANVKNHAKGGAGRPRKTLEQSPPQENEPQQTAPATCDRNPSANH